MNTLTITRPDDWHLHLRDGEQLRAVLPYTAKQFTRAIVMPNLRPPVVTVDMALAYRDRILAALPENRKSDFEPLMTLYLTDNTPPSEIVRAKESGVIHGVKLYPAGATTNSDAGVTDLTRSAGDGHANRLFAHEKTPKSNERMGRRPTSVPSKTLRCTVLCLIEDMIAG